MRLIKRIQSIFLAVVIGFAAIWALLEALETSTALVQNSPDMAADLSSPAIKEREVLKKDAENFFLVRGGPPYLTDPWGCEIWVTLDCEGCSGEIDTNNDGVIDASWRASGEGGIQPDNSLFEGQGILDMSGAQIVYTFENIDRTIRDGNDEIIDVVLSGRVQKNGSEGNEEFQFSAEIMRLPGTLERLHWQILRPDVSIQFEADGRLTISPRLPGATDI